MSTKRRKYESDEESAYGPATAAKGIRIPKFDSPAEATLYEQLRHYEFCPVRKMGEEYGLEDRISEHLNNIGWDLIPFITFPAFREPTLEFLATFSLLDGDDETPFMVSFQLNQRRFTMSLADFNIYLDFETEDTVKSPDYINALHSIHPDFNDKKFWAEITGGDHHYNPKQSKSTGIRDIALRYMHLWIAHTISAGKENVGLVTKQELFFLWCMVAGRRCDAGRFLLARCAKLRHKTKSKNNRYIAIGSFISNLAANLGVLHPRAKKIVDMEELDNELLLQVGIIHSPAPGHWALSGPVDPVYISNPAAAANDVPPPVPPNMDSTTIVLRLNRLESQTTAHLDRLKARMDAQDAKLATLNHIHLLLQAHFGAHPPPPPRAPNIDTLAWNLDRYETKMTAQFDWIEAHLDAQDAQLAAVDHIHKLLQTHFGACSLPSLDILERRLHHLETQITTRLNQIEARLNGPNMNGPDATLYHIHQLLQNHFGTHPPPN